MPHVTSKDGTAIAFEVTGQGPALILVDGAFHDRSRLAPHAAVLSPHFTVYTYDRRGRGESGDTQPYSIGKEIEDIGALIQEAGGSAFVFGGSSGAVLALDAAVRLSGITKLALYEPPFVVDDSRQPVPGDFVDQLQQLIASGRPGDAAEAYITTGANVPSAQVASMRSAPFWPSVEAVAHTLIQDATIMDGTMVGRPLPADRWANVTMPTLVLDGSASPAWFHSAAEALARLLLHATRQTLEGQAHDVTPDALAPALEQFFSAQSVPQ
jgi:pimeloyl-ACP methyl ester carboxylesterase